MSQATPLFIAPFKTGLDTDIQPWIAPPDSFTELDNLHVEHGFLEKRNGFQQFAKAALDNGTAVTGFGTYIETSSGAKTLLAFDTLSAYTYSGSTQLWTQLTPTTIFGGSSTDYVWTANWQSTAISNVNRLYFTNGRPLSGGVDGIYYFDGTAPTAVTSFTPATGSSTVNGARLIFSMGQRLVLLYTTEDSTAYPQRARWCAKQNPNPSSTPGTGGWLDTIGGGGDFADAATSDQIVSAQLLQNQLIVYFTDSVWALVPTSDPNKAFRWQKINNFRACDGKMATVGFDRFVAALGVRGITATDGVNTTRIDNRISDFTIDSMSQENFNQTFALRDYNNRRWWSLYNDGDEDTKTKALIYDDDSGAFSTYSIAMNVLGYGTQGYDYQLDEFTAANGFEDPSGGDIRLIDFNEDQEFNSYFYQQNMPLFLGGDYSGNVYVLEDGSADNGTAIEANFLSAAWNPFKEEGRESLMPYIDIYVETSDSTKATVSFYKDTEDTPYSTKQMDFMPPINFIALIVDVSQANPCNINAPSHGLSTGDTVFIYQAEGMVEINSGEKESAYTVTVVNENNFTLDGVDSSAFSAYTGGGKLYENGFYRTQTWKRIYAGGIGFQHRIGFSSSGTTEPFRIHGFKPYFKARGRREIN